MLIVATYTLVSYYINTLWPNAITFTAVAVLAVALNFEFLSAICKTKNLLVALKK